MQGFDLANLLFVLGLRKGAGDADGDGGKSGTTLGPGVADGTERRRTLTGATAPAFARQFRERQRRVAVDERLHVVKGRIGHAGRVDAPWLVESVLACVPAPRGQIETTTERHPIVDHDDFLVMRGAHRQVVVQAVADATRRPPMDRDVGKQLAFDGVKQGIVPHQEVDRQLGCFLPAR